MVMLMVKKQKVDMGMMTDFFYIVRFKTTVIDRILP